ncbi:hypothetical protein [Streptomyces sp. MUM 16J]|nr:hypothetical protein [Streptomyces sp. MUM 16J]MCH0561465.1 hypothetical protein [Streptomyces sp. MUM 16J]
MLRQQGCDQLADQYDAAGDQLTQQILLVGIGGLTGWEKDAVEAGAAQPKRFGPGAAHGDDPALGGKDPYIPRGFGGSSQYEEFVHELYDGLNEAGFGDAQAAFQGSSVTGARYRTGEPFDDESDYDIALAGESLLEKAKKAGVGLRSGGSRTGPLRPEDLRKMRLDGLASQLSNTAGRKVAFMIYGSIDAAVERGPSIIAKK